MSENGVFGEDEWSEGACRCEVQTARSLRRRGQRKLSVLASLRLKTSHAKLRLERIFKSPSGDLGVTDTLPK